MRAVHCIGAAALALVAFAGCNDESGPATPEAQVARGQYLIEHVAACGDCHTPRLPNGQLDTSRRLSGALFTDIDPGNDAFGAISAPNLTPDSTGLGNWSDTEIENAFQNGVDDEGKALFPIMPYFIFHNMTPGDADAVVAYLRSLPPVHNVVPERQPPFDRIQHPAQAIPEDAIPNTTLWSGDPHYASAVRGRYLAAMAGVCIDCHSKPAQGPVPVQLDSLFAGGRDFSSAELGLPVPPFPEFIYSANITPDSTGIQDMTPQQVVTVLLEGIDEEGMPLCPPMPFGPFGAFGGLTQQDATDISWYVKTIPPLTNRVPHCTPPPMP